MRLRAAALGLLCAALLGADGDALRRGRDARARGDHARAIVELSAAVREARDAGRATDELAALLELAAAQRAVGAADPARRAVDAARSVAKPLGPTALADVDVADGLLLRDLGDFRAAEARFAAAFEAWQGANDPAGAAIAAFDLGLVRLDLGRLDDAARAFDASLRLSQALGDEAGVAAARTHLGVVWRRAGRLGDARRVLEQAVDGWRRLGDAREADAAANLGLVLDDLGATDDARALLESALAAARSARDVDRQARLLVNLGALEHAAGRPAAARPHYTAAEAAFRSLGRDRDAAAAALGAALLDGSPAALAEVAERARAAGDRRAEAYAALALAGVQRRTDRAAAEKNAARAARLAEALAIDGVAWRADALLGELLIDAGRAEDGIARLRAAVDRLERTRRTLSADDAERFLSGHHHVYQALIDALAARGDTAGAWLYAERLQRRDLPPAWPDDDAGRRAAALEVEQAAMSDRLQQALAAAPEGAAPEAAAALRERLAALHVEFATTVDALRARHPEFDDQVRVDPEDLEAIRRELDPGVVVLQPVALPDRLVLLVFRRESLRAVTVPVAGPEVESAVSRLVRGLRAGNVYDPAATLAACDQLGAWLLAPIAGELAGADVLVVSTAGTFRQLPFGLLRHDGRWLVETMATATVTHVGSLRRKGASDAKLRVDGPSLLLVGNPDGSLPGAEREVAAIAKRFPGATVLVGAEGTRDALATRLTGKRAVHLATHGVVDPRRPDASRLVLGDAPLAYGDIPGLAPALGSCRLVVLSACESGLPVDAPAPSQPGEVLVSINGLAAQFRRAGVETLVASLWKVDDAATLRLMERFYDELGQGRDVAQALRRSQQAMLAGEQAHPWYWGAFVVVGDWR